MRTVRLVIALALLSGLPSAASARQEADPPVRYNVVSANPFLLLASWFNVEYERRLSDTFTAGLRGSHVELDEDDGTVDFGYTSLRLFGRYYPTAAFRGFFVGAATGFTRVSDDGDESDLAYAIGFELGYNWLLGNDRRLYLSLGIGADRLFGNDLDDASLYLPTARLVNIGIAF